jgi:hypothetical protein
VVGTAKIFYQHSLPREVSRISAAEAVASCDVYREEVGSLGAGGDARRPTNEGIAFGSAGQCHNHPFTGFPVGADVVISTVFVELFVDFAGDPEQRQLA